MEKENIEDILSGLGPAFKKGLLDKLVSFLLHDLNETERKEVLGKALGARQSSGQVINMVER